MSKPKTFVEIKSLKAEVKTIIDSAQAITNQQDLCQRSIEYEQFQQR